MERATRRLFFLDIGATQEEGEETLGHDTVSSQTNVR
jgi:hypothetical protein